MIEGKLFRRTGLVPGTFLCLSGSSIEDSFLRALSLGSLSRKSLWAVEELFGTKTQWRGLARLATLIYDAL